MYRNASDLEPLQPLLKKFIGFLENEVLPSTFKTSRPRAQLDRLPIWLGITSLYKALAKIVVFCNIYLFYSFTSNLTFIFVEFNEGLSSWNLQLLKREYLSTIPFFLILFWITSVVIHLNFPMQLVAWENCSKCLVCS